MCFEFCSRLGFTLIEKTPTAGHHFTLRLTGSSLTAVKFWVVFLSIFPYQQKSLAAYGASFVTKNSLAQKPIDVVSDDLADDFKDLQRNRYSKENLPKLPDLPPPSPTNALILPEEPQPVNHSFLKLF